MNEQNVENREKIIKQRQFEQNSYLACSPSTFTQDNRKVSGFGGEMSSFSRHGSDSSPGIQPGSVAAQKKRKDIEYKQKVLNVKQGKAFNEKMLNNMANKQVSVADLASDTLTNDVNRPINPESKHSFIGQKESQKNICSNLGGSFKTYKGSASMMNSLQTGNTNRAEAAL